MPIQQYSTVPQRILIRAEMKMLKYAEPIIVLGSFGLQKEQPLKKTDTVVFRRLNPFNMASNGVPQIDPAKFVTAEGVTPNSQTIGYTDVTATLQQYAVLFKYSSKVQLMYEDDIPEDMAEETGKTLAEVAELVAYGQIKAGSSVIYANGSSRSDVNTPISLNKLRLAARSMTSNRARKMTSAIAPGPKFGTRPVEPAFLVFHHSDLTADVRDIPGFTKRVEYGSAIKPVHEEEIGAVEEFRFIPSPLFTPFKSAGGTLNGCLSSDGVHADVYPMIITGADAWGHISLKGKGYKTGINPTIIPADQKNHANPGGMFGYVGADFWYTPVRLNENWMTRIEVAASELAG